ncbi:MAG: leucine--tRNA ligase [Oligoflexia bacterium]|nr:leucine--tRNA ligase [Oligoflexia bacterium]
MSYDFKHSEKKWQNKWAESQLSHFDVNKVNSSEDKYYILTMFPYPSGDQLHMGHWYQYAPVDSWARFQQMKGKKVFQPMGFDAFGLPAENYAIKQGGHPDTYTDRNVTKMIQQYKEMGVSYDWNFQINTSKPEYYKWTQWLFLQLYKSGLAYQRHAPVNWCPQCQTVLANEQVHGGGCERCDTTVIQKDLKQWFFSITKYADKLLSNIDSLDWPHKTKMMQKNWIGKSEGANIEFAIDGQQDKITVFTTRPDTIYGVTYVVFAPEHHLVPQITRPEYKGAVEQYIKKTLEITELDRISDQKEKSGVFTGSYAINPMTNEKIPIWISDYVLCTYGTGIVMAVPAHDQRDYEFAKKFNLNIKHVIHPQEQQHDFNDCAYTEAGVAINSGPYSGMNSEEMIKKLSDDLKAKGIGGPTVNFRLRDWLISRQRYWGTPIPIIYCPKCGTVPIPEKDLPVKLPFDVDFRPSGESPLKRCNEFLHTKCPTCGAAAKREVDTMDTFVCSSWYFLRFPNANNSSEAFSSKITNKMLPVDKYIGGPEHACMHLLYARFINMVLKDLGYIDFEEPFPSLVHQGLVLGNDGQKMSKSKGNAVSPDTYVDQYGSDTLRLYLMFGFNYIDGGPWDDGGVKAICRFVNKTDNFFEENTELLKQKFESYSYLLPENRNKLDSKDKSLLYVFNNSIKRAEFDTERFQFNTAIARYMELANELSNYLAAPRSEHANEIIHHVLSNFIILLAPFAPHFAEEWWEKIGNNKSVFTQSWPNYNESLMVLDEISMAVMINGKLRDQITVAAEADENTILSIAKTNKKVESAITGKTIVKHIFVPKKLINLIIK